LKPEFVIKQKETTESILLQSAYCITI